MSYLVCVMVNNMSVRERRVSCVPDLCADTQAKSLLPDHSDVVSSNNTAKLMSHLSIDCISSPLASRLLVMAPYARATRSQPSTLEILVAFLSGSLTPEIASLGKTIGSLLRFQKVCFVMSEVVSYLHLPLSSF